MEGRRPRCLRVHQCIASAQHVGGAWLTCVGWMVEHLVMYGCCPRPEGGLSFWCLDSRMFQNRTQDSAPVPGPTLMICVILEQALERSLRMETVSHSPYYFIGLLQGLNEQVHSPGKIRLDMTSPCFPGHKNISASWINTPGMWQGKKRGRREHALCTPRPWHLLFLEASIQRTPWK